MYHILPNFDYAPLITVILISTLCALLGYTLAFKVRYFDELAKKPIVPPFISVPNTFLALLIAFMASAVWQNSSNAYTTLQQERMALKKLYLLPAVSPESRMKKNKYIEDYVNIVQKEEWGRLKNMESVQDAEKTLDSLLSFVFIHHQSESVQEKELGKDAVRYIEELHAARDKRLSLGRMANFGYLNKWIIIYCLVLSTCFSIAIIHRDKPRTAKVGLMVFVFCSILIISIVSLYIHPYMGPNALKPDELSLFNKR